MFELFIILLDLFMALFMFLLGLYFYKSKGKASNLLTGYNMRPDEERKKFDEEAMCHSYGKRMMIMAIPFLAGAVIDLFKAGAGCALAWGIWIILLISLLIKRVRTEK